MMVLVVDDERNIRETIKQYLAVEGIEAATAENGRSGQRLLEERVFSTVLLDQRMPGMDGLALLSWIREQGLRVPVVMMSAYGEVADAVAAMKLGARDYVVKPFDPEELVLRIRKIAEEQALRNSVEARRRNGEGDVDLVGSSPAMAKVRNLIAAAAPTPSTVLITGESGTGKEVIARLIHATSSRSAGAFLAVNMGGIPDTLLESELFGYEKGAFTGASARKPGMFELAAGGTLFLDEIGEMPRQLQVKLLRVLQERRVQRLGGTADLPVDVRVVAATNRDLNTRVAAGEFREDLFYRLNVVRILASPLRDRREDIPALCVDLLSRIGKRLGKSVELASPEALEVLMQHDFPGNVRELENVLERTCIFAATDTLVPADLDAPRVTARELPLPRTLKAVERDTIRHALERWDGNRTRASEELGVTRRTLFNKIKEYDLDT